MSKWIWLAAAAAALAIAGCGGDSTPPAPISYSRVVVGYVYVENNVSPTAAPDVVVTNSTTAPDGYFKPTDGTLRLAVTDGSISDDPDLLDFDMTSSNAVVATVTSTDDDANFPMTVSVSETMELNGTSKSSFSPTTINLNSDSGANGTVRIISIGTPAYTAGAPASITILVRDNNGNPGSSANPFTAPETATGGLFISGNSYEIAAVTYDANGVAIPGQVIDITSDDVTAVNVINSDTRLVPSVESGTAAGIGITITASVTTPASTLQESFGANYDYGTVSSVTVTPSASTLLWETSGGSVNSTNVDVQVDNQFGVGVPNQSVAMSVQANSGGSAKETANVWNTTIAGAVFGTTPLTTANDGSASTTFSTPNPVDGDLGGVAGLSGDSVPKAANRVTGTVGSVSGENNVTITRPLGSISIAGPAQIDTNQNGTYSVTGATDVDNDAVASPSVTWVAVNTPGAGNIGNTGDLSPQSTSAASINASGILGSGAVAGQVVVTATSGTVTSNAVTTEIFGAPVKVVLTPDTVASVIVGANGEYAGPPNSTQGFQVSLMDAYGHTCSFANISGYASSTTISSAAAGSITGGGAGVTAFTLTFGTSDGTFTVGNVGTWHGVSGLLSTPFNITRTAGANSN